MTVSRQLLLAAVLAALIAAVYAVSLRGAFLWDDDLHITANPTIIGPLGLKEIWTSARANYFPLVLTNFWVQHALWGLEPLGYRLVTLVFHVGAGLLLWRVLTQLRLPGAWLGAALWALHPVQVESVAWICELKNTQSAVFFLLATSLWLRWLETGRGASYAMTLLCAALAILSKPSAVMLPVALVLCAWWVRGRSDAAVVPSGAEPSSPLSRRWSGLATADVLRLAPFFALSAVAAGWTIWEQKFHSGAIGEEWSQTLPQRFAIAGQALWFYLGKLLWPQPLIFIYPRWDIPGQGMMAYLGLVAAAALAGLLLWAVARGRARGVAFAAGYFAALLFPVLGFFSVYFFRYSFVGDHFQYLASMGPLALAGAAIHRLAARHAALVALVLVSALGLATARHSLVFLNNEALWRDTVAKNPTAVMAWLNLADTLVQADRHEEAIATYRHALKLRPNDPYGWNDLGCALTLIGQPHEAIAHLERSLELKPNHAEAHNNLGNALRAVGRSADAIAHYRRALELEPRYTAALNNLGAELAETGQPEAALEVFERARRLKANDAATLDNLGGALRVLGRYDEALARHRDALRVQPDFPEAHANLGRTLLAAGRPAEALPHFARALELRPLLVGVHSHYAKALAALGRPDEALAQLQRAVERAPQSVEAHLNLGALLASAGRPADALPHFQTAVKLAPEFPAAQLNLGNALAALQRWREAATAFEAATRLQPDAAPVRAQLGVALVNSGQLEAAVPQFEAALRLQPNAELHTQFAQVLRALGRNREALEHFERAAQAPRGRP